MSWRDVWGVPTIAALISGLCLAAAVLTDERVAWVASGATLATAVWAVMIKVLIRETEERIEHYSALNDALSRQLQAERIARGLDRR